MSEGIPKPKTHNTETYESDTIPSTPIPQPTESFDTTALHTREIQGQDNPDDERKPEEKTQKELLLEKARAEYSDFAKRYEKLINAYFGTPDIPFTMQPGGWYVDLENIRVNADPNFFIDKGYTESEALFATFHEAEHFRDMVRDPRAYRRLFARVDQQKAVHDAYPKSLARLYNCLDDVLVNKVVMNRWKKGYVAKDSLYPKLFASPILNTHPITGTPLPKHRQFMYAFLRKAMLPREEVVVDEDVAEKIREINFRGEGKADLVEVITSVELTGNATYLPEDRFALIAKKFEPAFLEFFKHDLEQHKDSREKDQSEGDKGNPFDEDPFEDGIPDPIDFKQIYKEVKKLNEKLNEKKNNQFVQAMGVEKKDYDAYLADYRLVEKHIEELSSVFDDVIQRRRTYHRRLRKATKDGPMLDPRKAATALAEVRAGNLEPVVMLDYESAETINNVPSGLDFTLVGDGSGSMQGNPKEVMQRRLAVLIMEAFADFRNRVEKAKRGGDDVRLNIRTEARIFADEDEEIKPLSDDLTHPMRIDLHKKLNSLPGGSNNEVATFQELKKQFDPETVRKLQEGELKKIILFLSDGDTYVEAIQKEIREIMELVGEKGRENIVIAGIGFEGGEQAVLTYAPHGYYAEDIGSMPTLFKAFLKEMLSTI